MSSKFLIALIFISMALIVKAQDLNDYQRIICRGPVPLDITKRTSDKVRDGINSGVNSSDKKKVAKSKSNFILKSNYILDELLTSGTILFGDDVTTYVNKIADKILKDEPTLRNELSFYCVRSNLTNAFSTHQGMIFITLGLISQLENEAQLAYVIGHEITHFKKKHSINSILESEKIFSNRSKTKKVSFDDNIIKLSNYSKTLELEADSAGFYMLENAGYDLTAALDIYDVLQFSFLPFYEKPFDYSAFESEFHFLPEEYKLKEANPIDFEVDDDDERSSHPNLNLRRELVEDLIGNKVTGEKFLIYDELSFNDIRRQCRYETVRLDLASLSYVKAYYNSNVLLEKNTNSIFLKNAKFKSLYGMSMYKLCGQYSSLGLQYLNDEGYISQAYHLFREMDAKSFTLYAIKEGWELLLLDDNKFTRDRLKSLIEFAIERKDLNVRELSNELKKPFLEKKVDVEDENEELSKYEQLKKIKENNKSTSEYNILRDTKELSKLIKYLKSINNINDLAGESNGEFGDWRDQSVESLTKDNKKESKKENENNLGLKKLVIIDPDFQKIDERKGVKLENSENGRYDLNKQFELISKKSGLEIDLLTPKTLNKNEAYKYNDISNINYCISETFQHNKIVDKWATDSFDWNFIPAELDYLTHLSSYYNTSHFAYTGIINFKAKKKGRGAAVFLSLLLPYVMPFALYYALTPEHYFYYYTLVYNVDSGEIALSEVYDLNYKAYKTNVNSMIYDLFVQMKKQK